MSPFKYNICFVYPDFENLGVGYLIALCSKAGHKVDLVTYQADNSYLGKKQKKILFSEIANKILETNPDIVALSCVTDNYQFQLKCAKEIKKIKPEVITVFGGIHPTAVPELVLEQPVVDAVAIGESDISFITFLKKCSKNNTTVLPNEEIQGIVFKKNGKKVGKFEEGPLINLDTLPFPSKEPFYPSIKQLTREYRIITSRGCPYSCSYCFNSFIREMRCGSSVIVRQRSVDNVIEELQYAKRKYNIKNVFFIDDSFTTDKKWITEFSKKYKKKVLLPFTCLANPQYIDKDIARLLKSAGCTFIQIGIQSLHRPISLYILNRAVTNKVITQAIKDLKDVGIMVQVDHMFGIPSDTVENQEEAVLYYNENRPGLVSVFWLIYYPKTPIILTALDQGILTPRDVKKIENGERLVKGSIHDGGCLKDPAPFYSLQLLMNYTPFLPKWLVRFLISSRWYRVLSIRSYYISTALPRAILCLIDKRYSAGRTVLASFFK
ncbi:MAG: radical SAM protein [Patescibacteria group bacterium]